MFFDIDFFGFRPQFWSLLDLQVHRAACSARRVRAYCIFCLLGHTVWTCLGEARASQDPAKSRSKFFNLGPCWHIHRSWAAFLRSWPVLERFLHFFPSCWSFFFRFWVAPDSILKGPGQVLGPSKPLLSWIFGVSKHASQKCSSSIQQNHSFCSVF